MKSGKFISKRKRTVFLFGFSYFSRSFSLSFTDTPECVNERHKENKNMKAMNFITINWLKNMNNPAILIFSIIIG
jgi:hypothetical protein